MSPEYESNLLAAACLVLVLIVCFMLVRFYSNKKGADSTKEGFGRFPSTACSSEWLHVRGNNCVENPNLRHPLIVDGPRDVFDGRWTTAAGCSRVGA